MNFFNPLPNVTTFPTTVTNLPPVVTNLPPIITRRVNIVNRPFIINQPHIHEEITQIQNHTIKKHHCCTRPMCYECCDFIEEGCCPQPCEAPCGPMAEPFGQSQFLGQQGLAGRPPMQGPFSSNVDMNVSPFS
jgi:hypothetical protein